MLATMVLAACSSDIIEPAVKRGMVLKANVEDTDTRATLTDNKGKYTFAFATNDKVKVGNDQVEVYYTFTKNDTEFASADALQTTKDATWCAFFPSETIDLTNQSGTLADVAQKYALAGATATPTTGSNGLTITMKAKTAVLRIVGVNKDEKLDINVRIDGDKYISGLVADKKSAGFKVETKDTKVSLLSTQGAGVYYVVVPADVKISVYNGAKPLYSGDKIINTTNADGLEAGKYYTLTTGKTKGSADNSLGETISWVQLWAGGPKFATKNVAEAMTWTDATKTGDQYVWGANWRTPTKDELNFVDAKEGTGKYDFNPLNTKAEVQVQNGVPGILYTGIQPGYTDKSIFLPRQSGDESWFSACYWSSTVVKETHGVTLDFIGINDAIGHYKFNDEAYTTPGSKYLVRPVLVEK